MDASENARRDVRSGKLRSARRLWLQAAAVGLAARAPWAAAAQPVTAAVPQRNRAGAVDFVSGAPQVIDGDSRKKLGLGAVVFGGQTIETGPDTEVHVVLDDGGFLAVRPKTRLQLSEVQISGGYDDSLVISLVQGAMRSITGWVGKFDRSRYRVNVGTATIGIRGTDHEVSYLPEGETPAGESAGVHNWVHEGGTSLRNAVGSVDIEPGRAAWLDQAGGPPQALGETPARLQRWASRNEGRVARHAERIREHIETRMRKRGMLKGKEHWEDVVERHAKLRERLQAKRGKLKTAPTADGVDKSAATDREAARQERKEHLRALREKALHHGKHKAPD